jgi:hypothetical protein
MNKFVLLLFVLGAMLPAHLFAEEVVETAEVQSEIIDEREDITGLGLVQGYTGEAFNQNRMGYLHPFLSLGGYHTDNLFNTDRKEESDYATVISPGIWVALPASRQRMIEVDTLSTAPGGLEVTRFRTDSKRRFQGYGLYRADFINYDDNSDKDHTNKVAQGLLNLNLRGGLSFELLDVYKSSHDEFNSGDSVATALDKYHSNLIDGIVSYEISPKTTIRADYAIYDLDYTASRNDYRDRTDTSYSGYLFYKVSPKFVPFIQYEHIDIDYDKNIQSDSDEDNFYAGFEWRVSKKTRGLFKAGYSDKSYDDSTIDDRDEFVGEAQLDYRYSPKTSVYLRGVRRAYATDIQGTRDVLSDRIHIGYRQKLTPKVLAKASVSYVREEYDGKITVGTKTDDRTDDNYALSLELGYSLQRWLNISAGYNYENRNSNFNTEDYTSNIFFINITAAL